MVNGSFKFAINQEKYYGYDQTSSSGIVS
jgi:hypothetical protein